MKKLLLFFFLFLMTAGAFAQSNSCVLTGKASDEDGDTMTFKWSEISGPTCTIVTPTSLSTQVTGLSVGVYVFQLTATDVWGASTSANTSVTVSQNHAPKVDAGSNQTIRLTGVATSMNLHFINPNTKENVMVLYQHE